MIIPAHKIIFIHNPKVAGESIIQALGMPPDNIRRKTTPKRWKARVREFNKSGCHLYWHENLKYHKDYMRGRMNYNDYYKFMFVRHPVDRFISTFKWYKKGGLDKLDREISAYIPETVNDLARSIKDIQKKFSQSRHPHFHPQMYMASGLIDDLDFIGKFETLEDDWSYIRNHLNIYDKTYDLEKTHERPVTEFSKREIDVNNESLNIIRDAYSEDFDKLGYE